MKTLLSKPIQHTVVQYDAAGKEVRRFHTTNIDRIISEWNVASGYSSFTAPPTIGRAIKDLGIDLVNLVYLYLKVTIFRVTKSEL